MARLKDLIVNGVSRFLGKVYIGDSQITTINGSTVGDNPKFTDTLATASTTGSGNAVTEVTASNGALTVTKGTTFATSSDLGNYVLTASNMTNADIDAIMGSAPTPGSTDLYGAEVEDISSLINVSVDSWASLYRISSGRLRLILGVLPFTSTISETNSALIKPTNDGIYYHGSATSLYSYRSIRLNSASAGGAIQSTGNGNTALLTLWMFGIADE